MRLRARFAFVVLLVLGGVGPGASSLADESRPNILLISLDTVRADYLTFRDQRASARMTELARHGTVFSQAVSGTSWTLPAHVQMFTGTPPLRHGVESDWDRVDPVVPFLPEILQRAGYYSAGVFTVRYLWGDYGFDRGFDFYRSAMAEEDLVAPDATNAPRDEAALERAEETQVEDYITSPIVLQQARRALERADPEGPVFLFAHFFDPHHDYTPPAPWDEAFDPDYEGDIDGRGYLMNERIVDNDRVPRRRVGDRDLEHIKALYRGEIAWTDRWVGELLDLFALHGRLDDTLVVIVADHGEEFFEHGYVFHRTGLHEELVRVPLLIVPPKSQREGLRAEIGAQVTLSDLMPTILDFAGVEIPQSVMGRSLEPAMYGAAIDSRPELLSLYLPPDEMTHHYVDLFVHAIRTPEFKFLRHLTFSETGRLNIKTAYFDLGKDPGEQAPITDIDDPATVKAWEVLEYELDRVRERWLHEPRSPDAERRTDVRETFEEELMALGYVESPSEPIARMGAARPWGGLGPMPRLDHPSQSETVQPDNAPWSSRGWGLVLGSAAVLSLAVFLRKRGSG